jgi:hypothetical protein
MQSIQLILQKENKMSNYTKLVMVWAIVLIMLVISQGCADNINIGFAAEQYACASGTSTNCVCTNYNETITVLYCE